MLGSADFEGMPSNAKVAHADGRTQKCVTLLDVCDRRGWHSHQNSALRSKTALKIKGRRSKKMYLWWGYQAGLEVSTDVYYSIVF